MAESKLDINVQEPDASDDDATVKLSPAVVVVDEEHPRSPKSVRFALPASRPSTPASSDNREFDSGSDAPSVGERAIKRTDYGRAESLSTPTLPEGEGGDPRLQELQPCVNCKMLDIQCDGVPCTHCEEHDVECTPSRETFEEALAKVTSWLEERISDLSRREYSLSPAKFLQLISEELGSNERFRFNFRDHNGKTQLVSYTRKCFYCQPEKLECERAQDDRRCAACIKENRICRRFAITFTNSDTRLGHFDSKFRVLNEVLSAMKDGAKRRARNVDPEAERAQPIRQSSSFVEPPDATQNQGSSALATFPWMAIFDSAIPDTTDTGVKDLTQYTEKEDEQPAITTGGFADIWTGKLVINLENHSLTLKVALKQLRRSLATQAKTTQRHTREMKIWSQLRHPNILPFLGYARVGAMGACFVSPWMPNGDVRAYLRANPNADRTRILNILVSHEGFAVLCDFGLAIMLDPEWDVGTTTSAQHGSNRWMAPERLLPPKYGLTTVKSRSLAADMFSFAMTAVEILTGDLPFGSQLSNFNAGMEIMSGGRPTIPWPYATEPQHEALATAIRACWKEHREERWTAVEVLNRLG
ncbi:kinase-like protein [Calocera viscosa TUFC12733]|uniref:Kinase-like protein n=1 Tax=Calocera viscosa (strain TUFC12733) TaxID=1330018 RepID=A0A167RGI4_CALVF|nr:kinase-like protein [Calocera viscosa TUFC12733]